MYSLFTSTLSADLMRENKIHIFIGVSFNKTALSALSVIIHLQMMSHAVRNPFFSICTHGLIGKVKRNKHYNEVIGKM